MFALDFKQVRAVIQLRLVLDKPIDVRYRNVRGHINVLIKWAPKQDIAGYCNALPDITQHLIIHAKECRKYIPHDQRSD